MKVESPITATTFLLSSSDNTLLKPIAFPILAPIHTQVSIEFNGGKNC
ncbi:unnamed protein product [marine sediment metagenome]|uniref:Uncharacterized protein n=1 Tax=marine sediment metagenome TaxID=412755 RepID=X0ZP10_9ZZZZ